MVFENGVKNIQAAAYDGARMVSIYVSGLAEFTAHDECTNFSESTRFSIKLTSKLFLNFA